MRSGRNCARFTGLFCCENGTRASAAGRSAAPPIQLRGLREEPQKIPAAPREMSQLLFCSRIRFWHDQVTQFHVRDFFDSHYLRPFMADSAAGFLEIVPVV